MDMNVPDFKLGQEYFFNDGDGFCGMVIKASGGDATGVRSYQVYGLNRDGFTFLMPYSRPYYNLKMAKMCAKKLWNKGVNGESA